VAKQEILFGTAAFEQLDLELAVQLRDSPCVVGRQAVGRNGTLTVKVNASDEDDAEQADHADGEDLVRQTNGKAAHRDLRGRKVRQYAQIVSSGVGNVPLNWNSVGIPTTKAARRWTWPRCRCSFENVGGSAGRQHHHALVLRPA